MVTLGAMALLFGILGFTAGYLMSSRGAQRGETPPINLQEDHNSLAQGSLAEQENNQEENKGQEVSSSEIVIGEATKIVYRTRYTQCHSVVDEVKEPDENMLGLKEASLKALMASIGSPWQVVRFSGEEVILFQSKDQICPQHYVVSHQDGYIAVYQYDQEGERQLMEKTAIPISMLPQVDQEKLTRGILLKSMDEVTQLLEDYSS